MARGFWTNQGKTWSKSAVAAAIAWFLTMVVWFIVEGVFQFDLWIWAMPSLKAWGVKRWVITGGALTLMVTVGIIWVFRPNDNRVEIIQQ